MDDHPYDQYHDDMQVLRQENADLRNKMAKWLQTMEQVDTLLDALRLDSGVFNILTKSQREIYKDVHLMVRAIASVEASDAAPD